MANFMDKVKEEAAKVKMDNEGLDLIRVNVRKDDKKSRVVVRASSEFGIDLPGDQAENFVVMLFNMLTSGRDAGN